MKGAARGISTDWDSLVLNIILEQNLPDVVRKLIEARARELAKVMLQTEKAKDIQTVLRDMSRIITGAISAVATAARAVDPKARFFVKTISEDTPSAFPMPIVVAYQNPGPDARGYGLDLQAREFLEDLISKSPEGSPLHEMAKRVDIEVEILDLSNKADRELFELLKTEWMEIPVPG